MKIAIINNPSTKHFREAVELGDKNSKTLGFLPKNAFQNYAKKNQLIGAFSKQSGDLIGYLLFRVSYNRVTIVHLCIDEAKRNKSTATKLINYLKQNTTQYHGIRLSCRNDYGIDDFWKKLNFIPVNEKRGRSKQGLPLTIWWYPHYQNNLFTQVSEYELNNKIIAVIDMNVFLDIKEEREQESLALKSDWILSEAILYYTREINIEINKGASPELKKSNRQFLSYFQELPFKDEDHLTKIHNELIKKIPIKHPNDNSDLKHIAYSISGGAQYFITRDKEILENKSFFKKYNLEVCRPSDFIAHLDENIQVSKYQPQALVGTEINSNRIKADDIDNLINIFLNPAEKKYHFQKIVRTALSSPNEYELLTVSKKDETIAFLIFDKTDKNRLKIPIFRLSKNNIRNTLAKHLLYKASFIATTKKITYIEICEEHIDSDIVEIIKEARFLQVGSTWRKISMQFIFSTKDLLSSKNEDIALDEIISKIDNTLLENENFKKGYNYERYLYPLKIKDLEIPTYIVPIQPQWAEQLFYDKSKEKLALYEPEHELLLNRENVYYRASKPKILNAPSRVLWYLSENKKIKGKGCIVAASYIDEIFIDTPKKLFKQFEKLGIYKWDAVLKTAGKNGKIMAFIFSDTELFNTPISLQKVKNIYEVNENKKFLIVCPIKITNNTYLQLYKNGMNL